MTVVVALLFLAGVDNEDWLNSKWTVLVGVFILYSLKDLWAKSPLFALALGYCLLSGVWFSLSPYGYTQSLEPIDRDILALSGLKGLVYLFALIMLAKRKEIERVFDWLWVPAIAASTWLLVSCLLEFHIKGPSLNSSMSSTLVAIMAPSIWRKVNWRKPGGAMLWALPWLSVFAAKSSIGLVAVSLGLITYVFVSARAFKLFAAFALNAAVAFGAFASTHWPMVERSFSGRLDFWAGTLKFWLAGDLARVVFGYGLGSYYAYGPTIQETIAHKFERDVILVTAHNDVLQCAFEIGVIGLALWAMAYAQLAFAHRKDPLAMAFFAILAASALGNFPHHLGIEAAVILVCLNHLALLKNAGSFSLKGKQGAL